MSAGSLADALRALIPIQAAIARGESVMRNGGIIEARMQVTYSKGPIPRVRTVTEGPYVAIGGDAPLCRLDGDTEAVAARLVPVLNDPATLAMLETQWFELVQVRLPGARIMAGRGCTYTEQSWAIYEVRGGVDSASLFRVDHAGPTGRAVSLTSAFEWAASIAGSEE